MKTIEGYDIKIFTDNVEQEALDQINGLLKVGVFDGCKIRVMSDVHSGAGCVIGFTSEMKDKVISNIVGVDLGCLDKDTEILTETGWVKISNYTDQKILVYDRFKEVARFEKPLAYIKAPCDEFYYFKNSKGLDQMLSEEHKMLITLGNPKRRSELRSKSLYCSEELQNPGFFYTKTNEQLIKGYYGFYSAFNVDNSGISLSDILIRIDIMVQADGHVELHKDLRGSEKHYSYEMHFKKDRKINRCKDLLTKGGIKFKEHINPDKSTTILFQLPESIGINKDITKYYLANKHQLEIVADECLYWDGSKGYRSCYSNTKKDAVDVIQFAFSATGIRAGIYIDRPITSHHSIGYNVIPTKNPTVGYTSRPTIVKSEDGFKYCFTTNTGFFVARRNNNIFITGNCGMLVHKLSSQPDSRRLQDTIEAYIPYGHEVRKDWIHIKPAYQKYRRKASELIENLKCKKELRNIGRLADSVGSLGGGEVR